MTPATALTAPDPMLYGQELPRVITLFPLGQAVEISTNSAAVEAVAISLWSSYPQVFESPVMRLRIAVSDRDSATPQAPTVPRGQGHLVTIVAGPDNFAAADLRQGFGFAWITRDIAANRSAVIWSFLEPLVYMMVSARHFAQVHAACVSLNGRAVVLCGESGAGKTCISYACARVGWNLVSGDAIQIVRNSGGSEVIGRPYSMRFRESARHLFPELRYRPVKQSPHGKMDIEIDTSDLAIGPELEARASHVVFLNRDPSVVKPFLESVSFEEAFAYLVQVVFYGDEALRVEQKRSLAELLNRPVLRLTYSDVDGAERALRQLVDS